MTTNEEYAKLGIIRKSIDDWLNDVNYTDINDGAYMPSEFALIFMNFIKLVNGTEGESNKTPPVHLKMLDKIVGDKKQIVNLCFRGAAKTTLFFEYLTMFIAVFGYIPGFGELSGMIYVSDSMENGVKAARKNVEFRYNHSDFMKEWVPKAHFTDNYLEFENKDGHMLGVKMFGAKTGLRGTKIFGKRPPLAILDDLISDSDSTSKVEMESIKDTVYKGINYALDPQRRKIIFNGTPFNKDDILVEAVESGAWDVNVWPVCEKFPCEREEFVGAWEDRFTYEFVKEQYDNAVLTGKVAGFMQELMLRISSEKERLVQDAELRTYSKIKLMENRSAYNFYITTDFATSEKQKADYSVIAVWAYNSNGDWFWVDGVCKRQTMDVTINDLFRLVQMYKPQSVGIEISGQQGAFIKWIQEQQMARNIWFSFASSQKNGDPGIKPEMNKLTRFNIIVPLFKAGKIYWPEEMKQSVIIGLFWGQIKLATFNGLKGKDDCIDAVSQLMYLNAWKPSETVPMPNKEETDYWDEEDRENDKSPLSSYIV